MIRPVALTLTLALLLPTSACRRTAGSVSGVRGEPARTDPLPSAPAKRPTAALSRQASAPRPAAARRASAMPDPRERRPGGGAPVEDLPEDESDTRDLANWDADPDDTAAPYCGPCPPEGDCILDFPYNDEELLEPEQHNAGRVFIPAEARSAARPLPVVVLLHGIDRDPSDDSPHRLLSPPLDLSRTVRRLIGRGLVAPLLFTGPSQTLRAGASEHLWTEEGFDLADYLDALETHLQAAGGPRIDRGAVGVIGHSGAGCVLAATKRNGLFRIAENLGDYADRGIRVRFLGLADICFYGEAGARFLRAHLRGFGTRLFAMWTEPEDWGSLHRDLEGFAEGLDMEQADLCSLVRYRLCVRNQRGDRLYAAAADALRFVFAPRIRKNELDPHELLLIWMVEETLRRYFPERAGTSNIRSQ